MFNIITGILSFEPLIFIVYNLCHSVNRYALKGIFKGVTFGCLAQSTGFLIIITYSVHIFDKVGAKQIDPHVSSIALAIVQIFATLCTTTFSDTLGRKALLIISLLGSAFGLLSFAAYSYFKSNGYELLAFEWVPVTSLSFVIFTSSSGCVPLMFICMVENLPSKVMPFIKHIQYSLFQLYVIILGSYHRFDHMQYRNEYSLIYTLKIISNSDGSDWFAWLHALSCHFMYSWLGVRVFCGERN